MRYGEKRIDDVPDPRVFGTRGDWRAMALAPRFVSALNNDLATDCLRAEELADPVGNYGDEAATRQRSRIELRCFGCGCGHGHTMQTK